MPVIDGEKWACSSCIKGHRVSGCNHNDRELHHINPKGRPVKQCEHCRGARKSKSHHAKCDCGDKKDKDRPKDKPDTKGMLIAGLDGYGSSDASLAYDGRCQCHLGAQCICGIKKEHSDLKLDTNRQSLHEARTKPKLVTTQSEPHLTFFANGHHRPCHRINNTAHVSGAPYRISRPHTLHGSAAFAALAQGSNGYGQLNVPTTRSMDTLSVSNHQYHTMFGSGQRSMDPSPMANMATALDSLPFQEPLFNGANGVFRQDGKSPVSNNDTFTNPQWPWTASTAAPTYSPFAYSNQSTSPSQERVSNFENDWSSPSAGFAQQWSAGDLPLDPSKFNDGLAQPLSHSGESKQSGPGLTAASSAHSEVEESNPFADLDFRTPPSAAASESLFWEDSPVPVYGLTTTASNEGMIAPVSMPAVTSMPNVQLLEPTFAKNLTVMPTGMTTSISADSIETAAIAMPSNFEDVMPVDSWRLDQSNSQFGLNGFDISYQGNWL